MILCRVVSHICGLLALHVLAWRARVASLCAHRPGRRFLQVLMMSTDTSAHPSVAEVRAILAGLVVQA